VPFGRAALESAGGVYSSNPLYGTQLAFFPKGSDGIYKILSEADMIIDETYWVGIPSLANISRSLGFGSVEDAQASVPAFQSGNIFRWVVCGGALAACLGRACLGPVEAPRLQPGNPRQQLTRDPPRPRHPRTPSSCPSQVGRRAEPHRQQRLAGDGGGTPRLGADGPGPHLHAPSAGAQAGARRAALRQLTR
jgi:hypothetical protein